MKEYLGKKQKLIDKEIEGFLEELKYPETISEGMKYSVLNGGKRIRPILLLMVLEVLEKGEHLGIPTGIAIELIHSYSLVHDDLPALDNDDYRRGKLTTHKKFGEAEAILIGDALLTHAFLIVSRYNGEISAEKIVKIIELISDYSGVNGMIGGQMVDIESEGKQIDLPTLQYIHSHKTGKLLKLPVEIGCIIGEASEEETMDLTKYAELIGLAFQIKDDILDVEGDFEKIGKPVGSDEKLTKSTYPSIFGLDETKRMLQEKIDESIEVIERRFGERGKNLIELAKYIGYRDK